MDPNVLFNDGLLPELFEKEGLDAKNEEEYFCPLLFSFGSVFCFLGFGSSVSLSFFGLDVFWDLAVLSLGLYTISLEAPNDGGLNNTSYELLVL